ncbi:MAG: SRPBCC family protein [Planctomycetota bacterium]
MKAFTVTIIIHQDGRGFLLETSQRLPCRREQVFEFFADAGNLERITPPTLRFHILTPQPIVMRQGALIDYGLQIRGVPAGWRSVISVWDPPRRFVDEQLRGPYRWWRHEHLFTDEGDETVVLDRVEYGVPGGRLVNRLFVAAELRNIFEFRRRKLQELLNSPNGAESGSGRAPNSRPVVLSRDGEPDG